MGAQVKAEFVESFEGEVGAVEQVLGDFAKKPDCGGNNRFPWPCGNPDIAVIEWKRAEAFVGVDFRTATIFEYGYGAIADVDIEPLEGLLYGGRLCESVGFGANGERCFEYFGEEQGAEEFMFRDVGEQIGVVLAECGEEQIEGDPDDVFSLR